MGCCLSNLKSHEEEVRLILLHVQLWEVNYPEYKEMLLEQCDDQEKISKTDLKEKFLFKIMDQYSSKYYSYHQKILDLILSKLEDDCSIYTVLFYLFSFFYHIDSKQSNGFFYEIISKLIDKKKEVSFNDLEIFLYKYYVFNLIELGNVVNQELITLNKDYEHEFDHDMKKIFSEHNIKIEVEKLIAEIFNAEFTFVSEEYFKNINERVCYSHIEMRDHFINMYGDR